MWEPPVLWLHAASDLLIGLACCGILVALVLLLRKRRDLEGRREAEALFRTLAEGIPSMAWVRRNDGSYEYLNPQWHAYTGMTAADLAERPRALDPSGGAAHGEEAVPRGGRRRE